VSDPNLALRSLPLRSVFAALGVDMSQFKERKGKNGREYYGKCFFHDAKQNNTALSFTDELAHCFSCGVKFRGAIDAVKEYRKVNFTQAVAFLQGIAGQTSRDAKKEPGEAPAASSKPVDLTRYRKFAKPCEWLAKRIPDQAVLDRFGVFYYENDSRKSAFNRRVMIPVKSPQGELAGYLGRATSEIDLAPSILNEGKMVEVDVPKYLFPRGLEKSKYLFGAHELGTFGQLPLRVVYVGESPWMVMRFAIMNLPAVALYGWSASPEQIEILATLTRGVCYLPDRNKSQESAGVVQALARRLWVRSPALPDGVDDAEYLTENQVKAL
jgi:hypothetical protein